MKNKKMKKNLHQIGAFVLLTTFIISQPGYCAGLLVEEKIEPAGAPAQQVQKSQDVAVALVDNKNAVSNLQPLQLGPTSTTTITTNRIYDDRTRLTSFKVTTYCVQSDGQLGPVMSSYVVSNIQYQGDTINRSRYVVTFKNAVGIVTLERVFTNLTYDAKGVATAWTATVKSAFKYGADGRATSYKMTINNEKGDISYIAFFSNITYDSNNQESGYKKELKDPKNPAITTWMTEVSDIRYNAAWKIIFYAAVKRNAAGVLIGKHYFDNDKQVMIEVYTEGRLSKASFYDEKGLVDVIFYDPLTGKKTQHDWIYSLQVVKGGVVSRRCSYDVNEVLVRIETFNTAGNLVKSYGTDAIGGLSAIEAWFLQAQAPNDSGLIASHPDETSFIWHEGNVNQESARIPLSTQAFTYDQAIVGIAMSAQGDTAAAKKILDFFYTEWQSEGASFSGFWSVYNINNLFAWKKYEYQKQTGPNCFMALFCLRYAASVTDPAEKVRATALATAIAKWIASVPRYAGAIAMTPDSPGGQPNFGEIVSTEGNLDYYAATKDLSQTATTQIDRDYFVAESKLVAGWLKNQAWDASKGLFMRGGKIESTGAFTWDLIASLDVNNWAIAAIGPDALKKDFGIDPDALMTKIEAKFMVRDNGVFDSDIRQGFGFDFSDQVNADAIPRTGMKWFEGTNQVTQVYRMLADYQSRLGNVIKAAVYLSRAEFFESRNAEYAILSGGGITYPYANLSGVQLYVGAGNWKTATGASVASAAWAYFSQKGLNPFFPSSVS